MAQWAYGEGSAITRTTGTMGGHEPVTEERRKEMEAEAIPDMLTMGTNSSAAVGGEMGLQDYNLKLEYKRGKIPRVRTVPPFKENKTRSGSVNGNASGRK